MGGGLENVSCVVAGLQGRALLWDRKRMQVVGKGPGGVSTVETGDVSPKWVVRHRHLWLSLPSRGLWWSSLACVGHHWLLLTLVDRWPALA